MLKQFEPKTWGIQPADFVFPKASFLLQEKL